MKENAAMSFSPEYAAELMAKWNALAEQVMRGGAAKPRPTVLAYRGGQFVSLPIDDVGNVIEPAPKCPNCGPVLWCSKHSPF